MPEEELGTVSSEPEEGTVSKEEGTLPEGDVTPPQEQSLTEERVKQLIAETREEGRTQGRREMQGEKDKEVVSAIQRAQLAEDTLAGIETGFRELDPEATESAKMKAELAFRRKRDAIQQRQQAATAHHQKFLDNIKQFIVESGVDVNDKGIDWGNDAKDYYEMQRRILTSVGKIQKENLTTAEAKASQKVQDAEALTRQEVDSVDTSISAGAGSNWRNLPADEKVKRALAKK